MQNYQQNYLRVVPRDLFNEGNLLKCYGRLWILLEDKPGVVFELDTEWSQDFDIRQSDDDGSLTIINLPLVIQGEQVGLYRPLNSRDPWPLYASLRETDFPVFTDEGNLSEEFKLMLTGLLEAP